MLKMLGCVFTVPVSPPLSPLICTANGRDRATDREPHNVYEAAGLV